MCGFMYVETIGEVGCPGECSITAVSTHAGGVEAWIHREDRFVHLTTSL